MADGHFPGWQPGCQVTCFPVCRFPDLHRAQAVSLRTLSSACLCLFPRGRGLGVPKATALISRTWGGILLWLKLCHEVMWVAKIMLGLAASAASCLAELLFRISHTQLWEGLGCLKRSGACYVPLCFHGLLLKKNFRDASVHAINSVTGHRCV